MTEEAHIIRIRWRDGAESLLKVSPERLKGWREEEKAGKVRILEVWRLPIERPNKPKGL